jgi:RHS repeat-associated protein
VATGYLTQYTYDLNNNLIGVTQNAQASTTQTRTYGYDDLGRLTSEQNPESVGTMTPYAYDTDATCGTSKGDLVKKTDAVGNVICYAYDSLHRLTSATYPSGLYAANTQNKYFTYDSATVNGAAMTYPKARLAEAYTATSPTSTKITDLGFSYTSRGEVSAVYESTPHSGGYYWMNATYWANGALDQIGGLPTLPTLTYTPDGEGRPAVVRASAGQNPVSATLYDPASLTTSMTLGSNDSDSFIFDPNTNRMTQFQFNVNSQSLTGTIDWNRLGTPASLDISDAFNSADTQDCSFAHDDLARLVTVNCGTIWGQNFTYDAFGNITKTVLSGSSGTSFQPTYAVPSTNRIASLPSFTPTYDANGNLTKDPQHQYGWDSEGRPVTIDSVTLTYDALDRMVEQNNAGNYTQIVYDPLGEKFGLMSGQTLKKAFAPLPDGGIAAYTSSGLAYYRHPDWLGSSRLASTPTRTIYSDTAYAPFGEPYAQSGTADPSFTGQNQDTASNLYDFLYREHSSIQGRWISPDPAGLAAVDLTDPQSWNRYAYVGNRPLISIDQSGLYCMWDDGTTDDSVADGGIDEGGCDANGGTWIADGSDGYYGTGNYTTMQSCASMGGVLVNCSNTPIPYGSLSTDSTYNGNNGNISSWSWGSTFMLQTKVFGQALFQNFKGEFKAGGCINAGIDGAEKADFLGFVPTGGSPVEHQLQATSATIAAQYAVQQGLTVPLRSSVVRGILEGGEMLAEGFAPLYGFGVVSAGAFAEGKAIVTGKCH